MSVAWTTILIIALLFPGVFFFIGLSLKERFSREVVRSNAIGEVGLAILIALILHIVAYYAVLIPLGFDLAEFLGPLTTYDKWLNLNSAVKIIIRSGIYTIIMGVIGFMIGLGAARLPVFARHKWITTVNQSMKEGIVTAYIVTTTVQNNRALMYKGVLSEFYLTLDGSLTYIILKNCSRFFMKMEGDDPTTTAQLKLFGSAQETRESWDYLFIDAKNIANALFKPSPEIITSDKGAQALEKALADLKTAVNAARGTSPTSGAKPIDPATGS
jgi:hypothetical protein